MTILTLLATNAAILVAGFLILWLICLKTRDVTPIDSVWALGMVVMAATSFAQTGGDPGRYVVTCNMRKMPLQATGTSGLSVAGVRYKAWQPPLALHPVLPINAPLTFDIYDTWTGRALGGCTYHVKHPGGRSYDTFPVNSNEAEARRLGRFEARGHTAGAYVPQPETPNPEFPMTLDLRRAAHI